MAAEANSIDDIVAVLKNPARFPSPVRAVGSNHSTTSCGVAEGGTVIKMTPMNRILNINPTAGTVTAQAGAPYINVAAELEGIPLLNQTGRLTRAPAQKGLGARLKLFADLRKTYDPNDRLLNDFFRNLLAE